MQQSAYVLSFEKLCNLSFNVFLCFRQLHVLCNLCLKIKIYVERHMLLCK